MKSFEELGTELGELVAEKNLLYGDSFGKTAAFLELLYPDGIKPAQYADLGCIFRIFDKLMRVATKKDALDEDPWKDSAGYCLLAHRRSSQYISPPKNCKRCTRPLTYFAGNLGPATCQFCIEIKP